MKKMLIMGAIALILLLALPGAVSADTTATITVSGTVGDYIAVSVTGAPTMALTPGTPVEDTTATLNVNSNRAWTVSAEDQNNDAETTGYMLDGSSNALTNKIQIKTTSGTYAPLDITSFFTGSGDVSTGIGVKQEVDLYDAPGEYSITIVFTGAPN